MEFVFNIDPMPMNEAGSADAYAADAKKKKGRVLSGRQPLAVRDRLGDQSLLAMWAAAGVILTVVIGSWYYFLPLTYGKPGLSVEQVLARKWLGYDLHFAK